jgi:hypothetical protein
MLSVFSYQVQTLNKKPITHYYRHWRTRTFLPHRAKSQPTDGRKKRRKRKRKRKTITKDTETGDVKLVNYRRKSICHCLHFNKTYNAINFAVAVFKQRNPLFGIMEMHFLKSSTSIRPAPIISGRVVNYGQPPKTESE